MDNQVIKPAARVMLFGQPFCFHDTFDGAGDEHLTKTEENYKKAGHKIMRKVNKQDPARIDLYVSQQANKYGK